LKKKIVLKKAKKITPLCVSRTDSVIKFKIIMAKNNAYIKSFCFKEAYNIPKVKNANIKKPKIPWSSKTCRY
jgi:hypothetical protein